MEQVFILYPVVSTMICLFSGYLLYQINVKSSIPKFRMFFNVIVMINILQAVLIILDRVGVFSGIYKAVAIQSHLLLFVVNMIDIQMLGVFSVLNENITSRKIIILKLIAITLITIDVLTVLLYWFTQNMLFYKIGDFLTPGFALYVIIFDNIQAFYLVYLVYNYKQKSEKGHQRIIYFNVVVSALDWIGIGFFIYYEFSLIDIYNFISIYCISIHSLCLVDILKMLTEYSIGKKKLEKRRTEKKVKKRSELKSISKTEIILK
ncbi:hypothetical protein HK103_001479 [Boothiomyces macroporosus]|uniref:Uncharacterized protein n=1 Tax=Boothiomyces macroporosus TaxID=261099 RepID=A0AAD5UJJ4_9FUNG|nr:hypothetical protein HK103_001479 [Boothiomyces macroporosus]